MSKHTNTLPFHVPFHARLGRKRPDLCLRVFVQNETQSSRAFVVNGLTIFRIVQSFPGHLVRGKSRTGTR